MIRCLQTDVLNDLACVFVLQAWLEDVCRRRVAVGRPPLVSFAVHSALSLSASEAEFTVSADSVPPSPVDSRLADPVSNPCFVEPVDPTAALANFIRTARDAKLNCASAVEPDRRGEKIYWTNACRVVPGSPASAHLSVVRQQPVEPRTDIMRAVVQGHTDGQRGAELCPRVMTVISEGGVPARVRSDLTGVRAVDEYIQISHQKHPEEGA